MRPRFISLAAIAVMLCLAAQAQDRYITEGRFGNALQAGLLMGKALETDTRPEYGQRPLTVEAWVRTSYRDNFNVFAAYTTKASALHWELYSKSGSGVFGAYLPGHTPSTIDTRISITDGKWHHVAMQLEEDRIRLYVDGKQGADTALAPGGPASEKRAGALLIGGYTEHEIPCEGQIDELRISRGIRDVSTPPEGPLSADDRTIGLWAFESYGFEDASPLKSRAMLLAESREPLKSEAAPEKAETPAGPGPGNRDYSDISFDEAEGRFGRAFDPQLRSRYGAEVRENPLYQDMPFTLECWVKLRADDGVSNAIVTGGYFQNPFRVLTNHWRLTTDPETGYLHAWFQGNKPAHVATKADVADGEWHYIAMLVTKSQVRLYADGVLAGEASVSQPLTLPGGARRISEGPLLIGSNRPHKWLCFGLIDELRMSTGLRDVTVVPDAPFEADERTTGLWHFDEYDPETGFADASGAGNLARVLPSAETLDENDRIQFGVSTDPFDRPLAAAEWKQVADPEPAAERARSRWEGAEEIMLNGAWDCVEAPLAGRSSVTMEKASSWEDAFPADVPCTIQTALLEAGRLPDPMVLRNDEKYQWTAHREWWLRRRFEVPADWRGRSLRLVFDGVDYRARFWLNGQWLGSHEGMWGGPAFDIGRYVRYGGENELLVALDPAPWNYQDTLKNNVADGWHYVKLVSLGIWRPVRLQARGGAEMLSPFLTTTAIENNTAKTALSLDIRNDSGGDVPFDLTCTLRPINHDGPGYRMETPVSLKPGMNRIGFEGALEDARLWWPNGMGDPNLYRFECELRHGGEVADFYRCNWGARTIEMAPAGEGKDPETYNWLMLVNGRRTWIKGANWCLPDALLRLDRKRLARYIDMSRHAHIQMFRVWGGGPIENDVLYDLCDEAGIMIQQEFSMLGYHRLQNVPSMQAVDMTQYMVPRLRNRPSLATWTGANEITAQGRIVEVLGRRILELDGTRPFRRSCPAGGDLHYHVYWTQKPLALHQELGQRPIAFTEFGMSSFANPETWRRILPEEEWNVWPPEREAVVIHHTPTFVYRHVQLTERFAKEYRKIEDMESVIEGIQLSQSAADKFLIERMRSRKPDTAMTHVYKLTENYPGASWSLIDYYGVPKRGYYSLRDVHQPVHVMALFDDWNSAGGRLPLQLSAVNDTFTTVEGTVTATLYDGNLAEADRQSWQVGIPTDRAVTFAELTYETPETLPRPLLLLLELEEDTGESIRNFYTFDFAEASGCLFELPRTGLKAGMVAEAGRRFIEVANTGSLPAPCVEFDIGIASDTFYFEEMGFWLAAGEKRRIEIFETLSIEGSGHALESIRVKAWNAAPVTITP
jgi:beta-mannosidase